MLKGFGELRLFWKVSLNVMKFLMDGSIKSCFIIEHPGLEGYYEFIFGRNSRSGAARAKSRNWSNQPSVQRRFYGAELLRLSIPDLDTPGHNEIFQNTINPENIDIETITRLLYFSFSCSGKKDPTSTGMYPNSAWSKRINASS